MSPLLFGVIVAAIGGLSVGSFLNVVIWRLPRAESLITPASHCPRCNASIKPYDNIPVVSWLLLRGDCRDCGNSISIRYPMVELLTGLLTTAVVVFKHSAHDIALYEVLALVLVPIALIDFDIRKIPNVILAPAAVAAVIAGALTKPSGLPEQLIAGAAAAMFLFVFALAYPRGMGMGDVKLAGVLGLFLGRSVAMAILASLVIGVVIGVGVMAKVGVERGRKTAIPFGPFLAMGAIAAIFCGSPVVHWYLHSVI